MATTLHQSGSVIVGYFADGQAAHRAINGLIEQGFAPSEIGAAFHVNAQGGLQPNASAHRTANVGGTLREELGTTLTSRMRQGGSSIGSPASDTTATAPGTLATGTGSSFSGAGAPGPISGSSLVNTGLPSELKSSLPHDSDLTENSAHTAPSHLTTSHTVHDDQTVLQKLKHLFGQHKTETPASGTLQSEVVADSKKFGTGEGDLHLNQPSLPYSQPAFEQAYSSYGVEPAHARHLSNRLGHGGALVTVHASSRAAEAERVLESYGAEVRLEDTTVATAETRTGLVEVFGAAHRDYPGYIR